MNIISSLLKKFKKKKVKPTPNKNNHIYGESVLKGTADLYGNVMQGNTGATIPIKVTRVRAPSFYVPHSCWNDNINQCPLLSVTFLENLILKGIHNYEMIVYMSLQNYTTCNPDIIEVFKLYGLSSQLSREEWLDIKWDPIQAPTSFIKHLKPAKKK